MAAVNCDRSVLDQHFEKQSSMMDRLKKLYPTVREDKTPLPRSWSSKEKYTYIGLSQNNLRVHYKGMYMEEMILFISIGLICTRSNIVFSKHILFFQEMFIDVVLCHRPCFGEFLL